MLENSCIGNSWAFLFIIILNMMTSYALAQVTFPAEVQSQLELMQIDIAIPTENRFKMGKIKEHDFFEPDIILKSRRVPVELHYSLIPTSDAPAIIPQVNCTTMLANLASNQEDKSDIVVHPIEAQDLLQLYGADWGTIAYFYPKRAYSNYRYAKLLSLYKTGRGMVYVLYLFNQRGEATVELLNRPFEFVSSLN